MAEYVDIGQYIMKLFDELIAECKEKIKEEEKAFLREAPRRFAARTTIPIMSAEGLVREMAERLLRINQELLNQYAISIAKKTRSVSKKQSETLDSEFDELKQQLTKRREEIEGLQAQVLSLEQRNKTLEQEKKDTLQQLSQMNSTVVELEKSLSRANEEFNQQLSQLNAEWEAKFQQNQEEWDSYLKLKLAEREVTSSTDSAETE